MQMNALPSGFLAPSLRPTPLDVPPASPSDPEKERLSNWRLASDKLCPLAVARYLITFFIGVVAAIVWQSYIDPAGQAIASAATPHDQQQLNAILLDSMRRSIDRIATDIGTLEEQISRSVDQLGASQDQMAREITKLQPVQSILYANAEPLLHWAPARQSNPVVRSSQAPIADARSDSRRQTCCQWPASSMR
jgi:hypothetical protein